MASSAVQHGIVQEDHRLSEGVSPARMPHSLLLLEDNVIILMDTEEVVRDLGVSEVWTATNTAEAFALLSRTKPACALLDVELGYENCFQVAARLRELGIPFAFVTGYGDNLTVPSEFVGTPRLLKPHSEAALTEVLQRLAGD